MSDVLVAWIETLPEALALVLIGFLGYTNRAQISRLLERLSSLKLGSLELGFAAAELRRAQNGERVSDDSLNALEARIQRDQVVIRGARVLWVDDNPRGNDVERRFLRSLGITVVNVTESEDALREVERDEFDVVVTDMRRGEDSQAGVTLAAAVAANPHPIPVIGYIGSFDEKRGTPPHFFGITDRPDTLVNFLIDAFERRADRR